MKEPDKYTCAGCGRELRGKTIKVGDRYYCVCCLKGRGKAAGG